MSLGLVYRDASLITLYLVVIGISIQRTYKNLLLNSKKLACFRWTYVLSSSKYRVASLSKL